MTGTKEEKSRTHAAYAFKRETRVSGRWLDIGNARLEIDTSGMPEHLRAHVPQLLSMLQGYIFLDRTPIGGFDRRVFIVPIGVKPPDPQPPQRPGQPPNADDEEL
jgi:hypothetical protein